MNNSYDRPDYEDDYEIKDILDEFDRHCASMREELEETFHDLNSDLRRANVQLKKKNEAVQVRSVLSAIMPILSDLKNYVLDTDDIDNIRSTMIASYRYMKERLSAVGVDLSYHERGDVVYLSDRVEGSKIPTGDKSKDSTCCRSVSIGWTIKGEEKRPSFEEIQLYEFDRSLVQPQIQMKKDRPEDFGARHTSCYNGVPADKAQTGHPQPTYTQPREIERTAPPQPIYTQPRETGRTAPPQSTYTQPREPERTAPQPDTLPRVEDQLLSPSHPDPVEYVQAEVNYDIYVEYPDEEDGKFYIARPGQLYPIRDYIALHANFRECNIWYGDNCYKIPNEVNQIYTKLEGGISKHISFYQAEASSPLFCAKCKKVVKIDR